MTAISQTETPNLDMPISAPKRINWEIVFYTVIIVLALFTRFYNLGDRVMSHDESLHALFSYKLYDGEGYTHDPLMHGPFQFHIVALSYLLFGDNDFAARIPAALFGVMLVIMPIWFRRWLGKTGALVTSFGLLISPILLYYDRYIRNESFIAFFTALMALALFQFLRTREQKWVYIGSIAIALSMATKEVAYIHGFIGVVFLLSAWLWESLDAKRLKSVFYALLGVVFIGFAVASYLNGIPVPEVGFARHKVGSLLLMLFGILAGALTIFANTDRKNKPVSSAIKSLLSDRKYLLNLLMGPVIVGAVIYFLLHTTFFTNPAGFISGTWGAISYWLTQQGVERGSQPSYYYLLITPMYEFLPVIIGGLGGIWYLLKGAPSFGDDDIPEASEPQPTTEKLSHSDGGTFAAYLIFWTIASFVIYSWAGEKMPWLTVHIALPFIFLMGHFSQKVLDHFNWRSLKDGDGLSFAILLPLLGAAILALMRVKPFQGQSIQAIGATSQFIIALIVAGIVAFQLWRVGKRLSAKAIKSTVFIVIFGVLGILTIRFAWMASFINYNYVNEFLVYAHAAPDVKWVLDEVDDISRRTVGDKQIKVAYGGVIWPLEWYMRDYPNRAFFGANPSRDSFNDAPVVIFSPDDQVSLEDVEPYLGDNYQRFDYRQVWWPLEAYKDKTLKTVWRDYFVPDLPAIPMDGQSQEDANQAAWDKVKVNRKWMWDVLFYRKVNDHTFKDWPYRTQMYLYVRKDVLNDLWDYHTGTGQLGTATVDPYANITQEIPASLVWGSNGVGDGQFVNPRAMTLSPQGQLYVADSGNHRIQVFDENGNFLKAWAMPIGAGAGQIGDEIWGIAVSNDGKVYVSDTWNHRVEVFDEDGNYLSEFGAFADAQADATAFPGHFWGPRDLLIGADGNIYVSDTGNKRIQKFSPDGTFLAMWGGGGITPGKFEEPVGLAQDAAGNFYVADTWNQRIQVFDADFNFVNEWDVVGWDTQNVINKPYLAINGDKLYVSDPENYRIIVYSTNGDLLSTFGQFGQDVGSFKLPLGLSFADDGSLFTLDSENNRVLKFDAATLN